MARPAGVDRSYLYRHPDLLAMLHTAQTSISSDTNQAGVTLDSLKADLINASHRNDRLAAHNKQLERKLSEMLGEQAWRESGLGAPTDIDELQRRITQLEQQAVELHRQLDKRDQELTAARSANRELFANLNRQPRRCGTPSKSSVFRKWPIPVT
ncbi:hypothetical protein ACTWPB_08195 [Nocardia sp. IBHARD005]|uniref:hypothetical protein n=1 Tax=Nocardia sp. IBHARD005 TaxID=3457765 RepID=UPI00405A3136